MSLTGTAHLYAALHEYGANDVMTAIYNTRRHLFDQGSNPYLQGPSSPQHTWRSKILGFVAWHARFSNPRIDFHPVPQMLNTFPVSQNQFTIHTQLTFDWAITLNGWVIYTLPSFHLNVRAVGRRRKSTAGGGVGFRIQRSQIPPIWQNVLAFIIDFVLTTLLNWFIFSKLRVPLSTLAAGAFNPIPVGSPWIDAHKLKLQGIL
jgi:hypothetical protein